MCGALILPVIRYVRFLLFKGVGLTVHELIENIKHEEDMIIRHKILDSLKEAQLPQEVIPDLVLLMCHQDSLIRQEILPLLEQIDTDWRNNDMTKDVIPNLLYRGIDQDERVRKCARQVLDDINREWHQDESLQKDIPNLTSFLRNRKQRKAVIEILGLMAVKAEFAIVPLAVIAKHKFFRHQEAKAVLEKIAPTALQNFSFPKLWFEWLRWRVTISWLDVKRLRAKPLVFWPLAIITSLAAFLLLVSLLNEIL